jgi:predicted nucleotide-binding protein
MAADDAQHRLEEAGQTIVSRERLPNDTGDQIRCQGGAIVNVFDTGKVSVQGKNADAVRELLDQPSPSRAAIPAVTSTTTTRNVFVVYGHDADARTQLEAILRRWAHSRPTAV